LEVSDVSSINDVIIWTGVFILVWAGFLCFIRILNWYRKPRYDPLQPDDVEHRYSLRREK
jgi:hypothetical protein